jgi:hypothetical protein
MRSLNNGGGSWTSLGGTLDVPESPAVGIDAFSGIQVAFAVGGVGPHLLSFRDQYGVEGWTDHPGPYLTSTSPAVAQIVTNVPTPQGRYFVFVVGLGLVGSDKALWLRA